MLSVWWPVSFMATDRGTLARSKFRTALRRGSWKSSPGRPAFLHASFHERRNEWIGRPLRWKTSGMIRAWARSHRRVSSLRRSRIARRPGVIGKARPSWFFVVPGSSRRKPPFQSTWDQVRVNTSARRHPVEKANRTPSATSGLRRDVAVLKIEDKELPVVRLARHSTDLHLGQALFVIGYPGVVVSHELLSRSTQYEPSITTGRISGFKQDIGGQRVLQTDAAIIQGNSGGPGFDDRGQASHRRGHVHLAPGRASRPGLNFLIPVETIQEAARKAGVTPKGDSMFTRLWNYGVD